MYGTAAWNIGDIKGSKAMEDAYEIRIGECKNEKRKLGNSNLEVSAIGLGCMGNQQIVKR